MSLDDKIEIHRQKYEELSEKIEDLHKKLEAQPTLAAGATDEDQGKTRQIGDELRRLNLERLDIGKKIPEKSLFLNRTITGKTAPKGQDLPDGPCIFCGKTIRHFNDGGIGWCGEVLVKGKPLDFLYCDQPPCDHRDEKRLWNCACKNGISSWESIVYTSVIGYQCSCGITQDEAFPLRALPQRGPAMITRKETPKDAPPKSRPTCTLKPPPVPSSRWDDEAWERWIAACCQCDMHVKWRGRVS